MEESPRMIGGAGESNERWVELDIWRGLPLEAREASGTTVDESSSKQDLLIGGADPNGAKGMTVLFDGGELHPVIRQERAEVLEDAVEDLCDGLSGCEPRDHVDPTRGNTRL